MKMKVKKQRKETETSSHNKTLIYSLINQVQNPSILSKIMVPNLLSTSKSVRKVHNKK